MDELMKNWIMFDKDDGAGGGAPADPPADPQADPPADPTQAQAKTFTQEELNAILAKEKGSEAAKLLKEMGVSDVAKGKAALKQLEEWKKERMSKEELLASEHETTKGQLTAAEKRALAAETKLAAVKLGVSDEYLDDVIKLLPEGEEPAEARLKLFLENRPMYLKNKQQDFGGGSKPPGGETEEEAAKKRVRKSMGLT